MDRSIRWKTIFLVLLVALSTVYLIPTVVDQDRLPSWFSSLFNKKVKLGLDLKGGLRIVYGLDLNKAIDDKASALKRDIETKLTEDKIAGVSVETPPSKVEAGVPVGAVFLVAPDAATYAKISAASYLDDYADQLERMTCPQGRTATTACFRVSTEYAEETRERAITEAVKIIGDRVDRYGVAEPTIVRKGEDIIVELPGTDEQEHERLRSIINRTAQLTFKMVDNGTKFMTDLATKVSTDQKAKDLDITALPDSWVHDETGNRFEDFYLRAVDKVQFLPEEVIKEKKYSCKSEPRADKLYECTVSGRARIEEYIKSLPPEFQPDDRHELGYEEVDPRDPLEGAKGKYWRSYYLFRTVELGGTEISRADVTWNPTTNRPEVLVTFNRYGARRFGDLTSKNVGKRMAIILDEQVRSAPTIQGPITGGRSTITMGGGDPVQLQREATDLVNVLRTGALPAPLDPKSTSRVGAMLGQDAIDRAKVSMVVGAGLVIVLMLFFYRFSGVIANFAMVLNLMFQIAILAAFQATLTLPGIAGIVLTIGMAVDSNIIIYERIREELRTGKSVRGAVDAGFSRAFWTVFDAHVTNFVAGFVLMEYGTGPIRGFAVLLLIGVVCNLFTSTWVSRLMFEYYIGRKKALTTLSI